MEKKIVRFALSLIFLLIPVIAMAQKYSVSYKAQSIEKVITDLRKKTGYGFVYQPGVVKDVKAITATCSDANLTQLLDAIIRDKAGLNYEIVEKTIVLTKAGATAKAGNVKIKSVVGKVTDTNGEPLIGATIIQEGTTKGTVTDSDGKFSMSLEGNRPTLHITYIGMREAVINLASNKGNYLNVVLQADENLMEEVLVTGYQNIKREDATGSYQTISSKEMDRRYTGSIVENLEGKIPGLVSYNNGHNNGGEEALSIRGIGSFHANAKPLVVVDGLPIEGSIETVNPYNIENITVLKDASAAAIYGARASNGVIVITTKRAHDEKVTVDFNADLTISEKNDYSDFGWANASELVDLEVMNFNAMKADPIQTMFNMGRSYYLSRKSALSPISRMLFANYSKQLSDDALNEQLNALRKNSYRKEWQDITERNKVLQQYNLSIRTKGKSLNSSIVLNYKRNNLGKTLEHADNLMFSYRGDLTVTPWLGLTFGTNISNERGKTHAGSHLGINDFMDYETMYNEDGSLAPMSAGIFLEEAALKNPANELKPSGFNLAEEWNRNFCRTRNTNIRSYVHANATILPGWTATAQFQYEDVYSKSDSYLEADSYDMRYLYNIYTGKTADGITHNFPDGGMLKTRTGEGAHYTFRAQSAYEHTFAERHAINVLAGFEFRETQTKTAQNLLVGYDDETQTNLNGMVNFGLWDGLKKGASVIGSSYTMIGAPTSRDFYTTDMLHRFYSIYFNANYTYDHRYAASLSYRVDKTDLFGADPEFRGRPLWSIGASWNIHNEAWMKPYTWIDALKLRMSYGLTGNINSDVSSFLVATIGNDYIYGNKTATLDTPPNDQLRWEKTASFNVGVDFSFWNNRLSGAFDVYRKKGTDLLANTDLDPTTGWNSLTINNGEAINKGFELQLNGVIIPQTSRKSVGVNASFNIAHNINEVITVNHQPTSGYENLDYRTFHEGYPIHSLFSFRYAGAARVSILQYLKWYKQNGEESQAFISSKDFTIEDCVYSGSLDPKWVGSFTPEITWNGFTLSAMFTYYGGHMMHCNTNDWTTYGSAYGYNNNLGVIPSSYLNYWNAEDKTNLLANGYQGSTTASMTTLSLPYIDATVEHADFLKMRNIVLGYNFSRNICGKIGLQALRLRFQINNVATWARNANGLDPEAVNPRTGNNILKTPRSYTMSLMATF